MGIALLCNTRSICIDIVLVRCMRLYAINNSIYVYVYMHVTFFVFPTSFTIFKQWVNRPQCLLSGIALQSTISLYSNFSTNSIIDRLRICTGKSWMFMLKANCDADRVWSVSILGYPWELHRAHRSRIQFRAMNWFSLFIYLSKRRNMTFPDVAFG